MIKAIVTCAALVAAFSCVTLPARAQQTETLKIGTLATDAGAEPYYADSQHFFRDAGLNVEITPFTNGVAIAAAVASGAIDIGYSSTLSLAQAHEHGITMKMLFPGNVINAKDGLLVAWIVPNDSPIRTGKDLNGKTIGLNGLGSLTQIGAMSWIDVHGGDSKSVHFVEVAPSAAAIAVQSHRLDAAITTEPFVSASRSIVKVFGPALDGISKEFVTGAWFASDGWTATHRDAIDRFTTAMQRTARWANTHQTESAAVLAQAAKVDVSQVLRSVRTGYAERLTVETIQPQITAAVKYGMLATPLAATDLFYKR